MSSKKQSEDGQHIEESASTEELQEKNFFMPEHGKSVRAHSLRAAEEIVEQNKEESV